MKLPTNLEPLLALAKPGQRPLDRLVRGVAVPAGIHAVDRLKPKDLPGLDEERFRLLKGYLYLYFDGWDQAHEIAQEKEGLWGNWLHAIVHRREPDPGNSRYWYARTRIPGDLSEAIMREAIRQLSGTTDKALVAFREKLEGAGSWLPEEFVGICAKGEDRDGLRAALQFIEWKTIFTLFSFEEVAGLGNPTSIRP